MYDVYCNFDLKNHMERYINYLEVIIYQDGKVEYAVPGHQEKLISIGMKKFHVSREEFINMCPKEKWGDYLKWLCEITECVAVWSCGYCYGDKISEEQRKVLKDFIRHGVMKNQIMF